MEWVNGDHASAIHRWRKVTEAHTGTDASFGAQFNLAQAGFIAGDRRGSIDAYLKLISFPTPVERLAGAVERCSNARHRACLELSDMCLETQELAAALRYAELALNKYQRFEFGGCGLGCLSHYRSIDDRIRILKAAIATGDPVSIAPRKGD